MLLQTIGEISTTKGNPIYNAGPIMFILFVTAVKDIFEDYKRHKADAKENNEKYMVYK